MWKTEKECMYDLGIVRDIIEKYIIPAMEEQFNNKVYKLEQELKDKMAVITMQETRISAMEKLAMINFKHLLEPKHD